MRRMLTYICVLMLLALVPAVLHLSAALPVDTGAYIAKKYAGWNGVLQAWVCCDWDGGGSWISWLNRCASRFEKNREGVYIEFTPVSRQMLNSLGDSGLRMPELILFSPGILSDPGLLDETAFPDALRRDLYLDSRAVPVAMGGSIWAVNPAADGPAVCSTDNALALIGLCSGGEDVPAPESPGLDLGLPVFAADDDIEICGDALDRFIDGEACRIAADAGELAGLIRLQENGRGPDWVLESAGEFVCVDQLLYAGVTRGDADPRNLARQFIALLLDGESQRSLADIGAFAVTGESIHAAHSPRAIPDAMLQSLPLAAALPFSEHSPAEGEAIVRSLLRGMCTPREAAAKMGLGFSLPNYPN